MTINHLLIYSLIRKQLSGERCSDVDISVSSPSHQILTLWFAVRLNTVTQSVSI